MSTLTSFSTLLFALAPSSEAGHVTTSSVDLCHFDGARPRKVVDAEQVAAWKIRLGQKFGKLRGLDAGWAGEGSREICNATIFKAERVLSLALEGRTNPELPSIVPVADGGLQIEWHGSEYDFEIYFGPDDSVTAIMEDLTSGIETEKEGNAATDLLFSSVARLAQKRGHEGHASAQIHGPAFEFAA